VVHGRGGGAYCFGGHVDLLVPITQEPKVGVMTADARVRCPRCDYDQHGVVASWKSSCPLIGRCSECGLDLLWRDLLNPAFAYEPTFFELAKSRFGMAFAITTLRTLRPRSFWRWVHMEYRIAWVRAAVLGLGGAAVFHLTATAAVVCAAVLIQWGSWPPAQVWNQTQRWVAMSLCPGLGDELTPLYWHGSDWGRKWNPWPVHTVLWTAMTPLAFVLLPATLRRAKVRPAHLRRILLYSLAPLPLVLAAWRAPTLMVELFEHYVIAPIAVRRGPGPLSGIWPAEQWCRVVLRVFNRWRDIWQILLGGGFVLLWWRAAARHYLRLPSSGMVAIALTVLAGLAALLLLVLIPGVSALLVSGL
jgi:hypothetical protein